jgi:hypothetical protein
MNVFCLLRLDAVTNHHEQREDKAKRKKQRAKASALADLWFLILYLHFEGFVLS